MQKRNDLLLHVNNCNGLRKGGNGSIDYGPYWFMSKCMQVEGWEEKEEIRTMNKKRHAFVGSLPRAFAEVKNVSFLYI